MDCKRYNFNKVCGEIAPVIIWCRLDRVEMRRWVTSDVTHQAHGEAKRLLSDVDKDKVRVHVPLQVYPTLLLSLTYRTES